MPAIIVALVCFVLFVDTILVVLLFALKRRGVSVTLRSKFGPVLVFDSVDGDGVPVRLLNVGGKFQSVCYTDPQLRWELCCIYHRYFAEILDIAKNQKDEAWSGSALVLGGGGYSFPKWLISHCPDVQVTVVEIDSVIIKIAQKKFFLSELQEQFTTEKNNRLSLVCDDAWDYLLHTEQRWDVIVNDAFGAKHPLGPLGTVDGLKIVHAHLSENGLYLANVISPLEGKQSELLQTTIDACVSEFSYVYLIPECPEDPQSTGNNVLIASDRKLAIQHQYLKQPRRTCS